MQHRTILDIDTSSHQVAPSGPSSISIGERTSLQVLCEFDSQISKIRRKVERGGFGNSEREDVYGYSYDNEGRLAQVTHNHLPMEKYEYNDWGQRWCRQSGYNGIMITTFMKKMIRSVQPAEICSSMIVAATPFCVNGPMNALTTSTSAEFCWSELLCLTA